MTSPGLQPPFTNRGPYIPDTRRRKTPKWVWIVAAVIVLAVIGSISNACSGGSTTSGKSSTTAMDTATVDMPTSVAFAAPAVTASAAPQQLVIPANLIGQNGAIANDRLKKAGFTNIQYASGTPGVHMVILYQDWTVQFVEPGPGIPVSSDSPIVVTMTKNNR